MTESSKSIFITGAAAGIGRATALRFAAAGWRVGLYDIDLIGLKLLASQIGPQAVIGTLDVTDELAFAEALAEFVEPTEGRLDVLFNNAGVLVTGDFEATNPARYRQLIEVNAQGVVNGCHAAFPYLKAARGRVVNMASASAIYGAPSFAVYSATKFFVRGITEALDIEWARHGIQVSDVMPLFVATPMVQGLGAAPKSVSRLGVRLSADDIAGLVYKAACQPRWRAPVHHYPAGQTRLMARAHALLPARLWRAANKFISGY